MYESCKELIALYKGLAMEEKSEMPFLQLSEQPTDPTHEEILFNLIRPELPQTTFLHNEVAWYPVSALNAEG